MYQIAVDIGGTFTDCVVLNEEGERTLAKAFSVPTDPSVGVLDAVAIAAKNVGVSVAELLSRTTAFVHGCTVATNAMIERTGARTALLTTRGHEDTIFVGRLVQKIAGLSEREIIHTSRLNKAEPPIVPRRFVCGINERIDVDGEVVVKIDPDEVDRTVDNLVSQGVEAIAICFLWSFLNPTHEQIARDRIRKRFPGMFVSVSSDLVPLLGEYERSVTTVLNAFLGPKLAGYLERLENRLIEQGYRYPLLIMQSSGGLSTAQEARNRAVLTLDSGPVGGTLGSLFYGRLYDEGNILCTDVGGTSFDVSVISRGELQFEQDPVIDKYAFRIPKVLIKSIGAGGGSVAWLDAVGGLRVGPKSAGSVPGPACYGRGGTEPTVTDANLVLGYLNPEFFLGGRARLDRAAAQRAIAVIASALGMSVVEAAAGIFKIINAQMADLIRRCTIERGLDPREFLLFAYGGAGPAHAAFYAGDAETKGICVLAESTVFSALGMLTSDVTHTSEASLPLRPPLSAKAFDDINRVLDDLERRVVATFAREGMSKEILTLNRSVSMRYQMQVYELEVPLPNRRMGPSDAELIEDRFEERYRAVYGDGAPYREAGTELVSFRVIGSCRLFSTLLERISAKVLKASAMPVKNALKGYRRAYFEVERGYIETPIYDGVKLETGHSFKGPAIVERMGDTVVVPPDHTVQIDRFRNLRIGKEVQG